MKFPGSYFFADSIAEFELFQNPFTECLKQKKKVD